MYEFKKLTTLDHGSKGIPLSRAARLLLFLLVFFVNSRQHELKYNSGKMYLNYTSGAKCENGTKDDPNYRFHVLLTCDYTPDASPIDITDYSGAACSFYVYYKTPLACLPIPDAMQSNSCSVQYTKTGKTFDLMPLSDSTSRTSNRQGSFFLINVCKPVQYGQNTMCPAGSSICLFTPGASEFDKRFINFGNVQSKPVIKDGQLLLRHETSKPCDKNSSMNYASVINFNCDRKAFNAHAEFIGLDQDGCTNKFSFVTPLACQDIKNCTAITVGNELLDLSPLIGHGAHKLSKDGKNYTVAACTSAGAPCMADEATAEVVDVVRVPAPSMSSALHAERHTVAGKTKTSQITHSECILGQDQ